MVTKAATGAQTITLNPLKLEVLRLRVVGDTELIVHAWSEKAKKEMLAAQQKKPKTREIRNPEQEYLDSMYPIPEEKGGGYGFPALALNGAIVEVAHNKRTGIEKTLVRQAIRVNGDVRHNNMWLCRIHGTPEMREDMVRVGMGTADLRYRANYFPWHMDLTVTYDADLVTADTVVNLLNRAGFGCGIGEWRPQKDGQSGTFHVESIPDVDGGV